MDWKDIKRDIFDRLGPSGIEDLIRELNPKHRGQYLEMDCPGCGAKGRAYLYLPSSSHPEPRIKCNRVGSCAYSKTLMDYLMERDGRTFMEELRFLAEESGVEIPDITPEVEASWERKRTETEALERFHDFFQETLWSEDGKATLDYLRGRGYSDEDIKAMGLGCFPGKGKTLRFMAEELGLQTPPEALQFALHEGLREHYKLVFPYRKTNGDIATFIGRLTRPLQEGEREGDKYKPMGHYGGVQGEHPFGLHAVRGDTAIVVEGFLDALLAGARGIHNVVALSNSRLLTGQDEAFRKRGIKKLILALDNDEAGREGTEYIIRKLLNSDITTYVASFWGAKDPDELILERGESAFRNALEKAKISGRGIKWLMEHIGEKYDLETDEGRDEVLREVQSVTDTLRNPLDVEDAKAYMGVALRMNPEDIAPYIDASRERFQRDELARDIQKALQKAQEEAQKDPEKALAILKGTIEISEAKQKEAKAHELFPPFSLEDFLSKLKESVEGLRSGYPDLDARARFPQGAVTLVAGRPNHGKTATLLNFLRQQIEGNPGKRYVFASYEEDEHKIITKLLISMANRKLGEEDAGMVSKYQQAITGTFPASKDSQEHLRDIRETWERLRALLESRRLIITYRPGDAKDLSQAIRGLRDQYGEELGAVFLDYMQIIPAPEELLNVSSSYQKVQGISAIIRDLAVETNLPIIAGAQLNRRATEKTGSKNFSISGVLRPEFLREAGDLEQDANLILGIYNKVAGANEDNGASDGNIPDFSLSILKNREGPVGGPPIELEYDRPLWRMDGREKETRWRSGKIPGRNDT
jgi:DNA primase